MIVGLWKGIEGSGEGEGERRIWGNMVELNWNRNLDRD